MLLATTALSMAIYLYRGGKLSSTPDASPSLLRNVSHNNIPPDLQQSDMTTLGNNLVINIISFVTNFSLPDTQKLLTYMYKVWYISLMARTGVRIMEQDRVGW